MVDVQLRSKLSASRMQRHSGQFLRGLFRDLHIKLQDCQRTELFPLSPRRKGSGGVGWATAVDPWKKMHEAEHGSLFGLSYPSAQLQNLDLRFGLTPFYWDEICEASVSLLGEMLGSRE